MHKRLTTLALILIGAPSLAQNSAPWPMIREFGGASPIAINSWVKAGDYPSDALRKGEQGNVVVKFDIDIDGRAKNCELETPSGVPSLDVVPCKLLEKRARFKPATNEAGKAVETTGRYSVAFWIPD